MKITGEHLLFLVQVLKDSLDIQTGYDWNFTHKRKERELFYDKFIQSLLSQQDVNIQGLDLSNDQNK